MAVIFRTVSEITNFDGGPGANVWFFDKGIGVPDDQMTADSIADHLFAFYSDIENFVHGGITIRPAQYVQMLDVASGEIRAEYVPENQTPVVKTGSSGTPSSCTALLQLRTKDWVNGSRLSGSKHIGPLSASTLTSGNDISAAARAAIEQACIAMTSGIGPRLSVYRRPTEGKEGAYAAVSAYKVRTLCGILKSRRG